jgi:hypothetical protein
MSYVFSKLRGEKNIKSIHLEEYLRKTKGKTYRYPKFGGLKVEKSSKRLSVKYSSWQEIVDQLIDQGLG